MISIAFKEDRLETEFSAPESINGETLFESFPVITCRLRVRSKDDGSMADTAEIHFRMDSAGRLCFSLGCVYDTDGNMIKLYDNKFSLPSYFSFFSFCLLSDRNDSAADAVPALLKGAIASFGHSLPVYRVVMPFFRENTDDPKKKYGARCLFRIKMKNGEPDISEFYDYIECM